MGFWDTLGKVAKGVGEHTAKRLNDLKNRGYDGKMVAEIKGWNS